MKGRFCEAVAIHVLLQKNYSVLEKNYNCIEGEVDIISSKGQSVIFLEVKAWNTLIDNALEKVISLPKLHRLKLCALQYLDELQGAESTHTWKYVRFDVIVINISHRRMVHYKGV